MTTYKARVYIDGHNFYRAIVGRIRNNIICPYPSLHKLCDNKLKSFPTQIHAQANINIEKIDLSQIWYFTAMVNKTYEDQQKRERQERYNSALDDENVKVILGEFEPKRRRGEIVLDRRRKPRRKEKQTDVNLATRFVYDACNKKCNYAVIISNDTDFCGAIEFVREKYPEVIVDVWTAVKTCQELRDVATVCHKITPQDFEATEQIANFHSDPRNVKMP